MDNQNLFNYLYDAYVQSLSDGNDVAAEDAFPTKDEVAVKKFCDFCREHLTVNTPISMGFEDTGVGFQLQDGTHLVFVEQRASEQPAAETVVPVTMSSTTNRGMSSIRTSDEAVAITKGQERSDSK